MAQAEDRLERRSPAGVPRAWLGVCLVLLSLILLLQCWKAPFLTFDDGVHITNNQQVTGELTLARVFLPQPGSTYFPVTVLTYRLDRALFSGWMPQVLESWAPGVRLHTWLYHAAATLLVWQILLALGVSPGRALFAAGIFAVHPTACETVCWASERKNALAGCFGFAAVWCWLRLRGTPPFPPLTKGGIKGGWHVPAVLSLFLLALMSKPSALGLLPVFVLLELLRKRLGLLADARGSAAPRWSALMLFGPLLLMSAFIVWANVAGHERTLVPPPGGSVFTALLTDTGILTRYLGNLLLPVRLSFVYYVQPITSLLEPRLWAYVLVLAAAVGGSLLLAAHKPRALLGWGWFLLALSPNLNVISILQLMQDRYLYLSFPGFLLVLIEVAAGVAARLRGRGLPALKLAAAAYVVFLAVLGFQRSGPFKNAYRLFTDAVEKQPLAAHARFGLALACAQVRALVSQNPGADPRVLEDFRRRQGEQLRAFMDICPDRYRQPNYSDIALDAGNFCADNGDVQEAERYYGLSAAGAPGIRTHPHTRSEALKNLAGLKLRAGDVAAAYALATDAVKAAPELPESRFVRAQTALALAKMKQQEKKADEAELLREQARNDLDMVPAEHPLYAQARELRGK